MFIIRTAEKTFQNLLRQYPVVAVTCPRQSGKTTLVRHACPDKPYVLLGIHDPAQLRLHPLYGPLFETFVISEFLKARWHAGQEPNLYFWRDRSGHEVDLLVDEGHRVLPVEVKAGQTVAADFLKPIKRWQMLAGDVAGPARLVYGGTELQERTDCTVIPWRHLAREC